MTERKDEKWKGVRSKNMKQGRKQESRLEQKQKSVEGKNTANRNFS